MLPTCYYVLLSPTRSPHFCSCFSRWGGSEWNFDRGVEVKPIQFCKRIKYVSKKIDKITRNKYFKENNWCMFTGNYSNIFQIFFLEVFLGFQWVPYGLKIYLHISFIYVCSVQALVTFLVWKVDLWPVWCDIPMAKNQSLVLVTILWLQQAPECRLQKQWANITFISEKFVFSFTMIIRWKSLSKTFFFKISHSVYP